VSKLIYPKNASFLALTLLSLLTFTSFNTLAQYDEIHIASEPWEDATNKDGTGLYWEIFQRVFESEGIKVKPNLMTYQRSMGLVQESKVDASVAAYKNEVEQALYPRWHFDADIISALYRTDSLSNFQREASLKNKHVAWIDGYKIDQHIDKNFNLHKLMERKHALKLLDEGKIDFFVDAEADLNTALNKGYVDKQNFTIDTLKELNLYLVFSDNERGHFFRELYDRRMGEMIHSGELKALFEKWDWNIYPFG